MTGKPIMIGKRPANCCYHSTPTLVIEFASIATWVEQPEVAEPTVNQEIRFRLRCLFSSMGHTYSLSAMSCPDQAAQLMQTARKWYQFKAIDPVYAHGGTGTQLLDT